MTYTANAISDNSIVSIVVSEIHDNFIASIKIFRNGFYIPTESYSRGSDSIKDVRVFIGYLVEDIARKDNNTYNITYNF